MSESKRAEAAAVQRMKHAIRLMDKAKASKDADDYITANRANAEVIKKSRKLRRLEKQGKD